MFLADRVSKRLVLFYIPENSGVAVAPGVFHLTRVNNPGAAFGFFRGAGFFLTFVTAASIALLSGYLLIKWDRMARRQRWGWMLVIGGAFGNLYDRLFYGHVIDFLDFRVWPVFNLADSFVCVGVFLVFWSLLKK